jgi:predicted GIY-YIG superfamily endonuclease
MLAFFIPTIFTSIMKRTHEEHVQHYTRTFKTVCQGLDIEFDKQDVFSIIDKLVPVHDGVDVDLTSDCSDSQDSPRTNNKQKSMSDLFGLARKDQNLPMPQDRLLSHINLCDSPCVIYVLKLMGGRIYVGRSDNQGSCIERIQSHIAGNGSEWTKMFPVVDLIERFLTRMPGAEEATTIQYIISHGIDMVRGGSQCQIVLPQSVRDLYTKMIVNFKNQCFRCGLSGHFVKDCMKSA